MHIEKSTVSDLRLFLNHKNETTDNNIIYSLTNRKGIILYANEKFCEVSGYGRDELIGANHNIVNSGLHSKDFFKDMWRTIGKGIIWQGEIRNKAKNGSFYWVDTIIFPVYEAKLDEKQYFSIRTLINDKKKAEQEKEQRIQELRLLLFKISHGLRQPITQLMGIANLLADLDAISSERDINQIVQYIQSSSQVLDDYTKELTKHIEHIADKEHGSTSKK